MLVENYNTVQNTKILASNIDGFRVFPINDIFRLEGDSNYTNFIFEGNKKIPASKTLGE
mgnify:CR=1 FL=1